MSWFTRRRDPPVLEAYRHAVRKRLPLRTPWAELPLVVLDSETTGFQVGRDRILSLAALPLREGRIPVADLREWVVYQKAPRPTAATAVHGILPAEIREGLPEEAVLAQFLPLLSPAVIVAHHARFDVAMLDEMLRRHYGCGLRNPFVDTAALAMDELEAFKKTGYANQRPPGLDEVCAQLDLPMVERHTAVGDTFTTAELFLLLCGRRRRRLRRPLTLRDLAPGRL